MEPRGTNLKRLVLTMSALVGFLLVLGILLRRGSKSAAVAEIDTPSAAPVETISPKRLAPPEELEDTPTREQPPDATTSPDASEVASAASVAGTVLDAETGVPLDRFDLVHSPTGAGGTYVDTLFGFELEHPHPSLAFADAGGRFTLHELGPDARNVTIVAPGYEIAKIQVVETDPDVVHEDLVFKMRRAVTVRGRVIDPASGVPVEGALVAWIDDGGQARTGPKERFERTDALGRFALDYVPAGPRRLLAGREDLGQAFSPSLTLEPGDLAHEIVIELGPPVPK